jgi:single stranded DNA-binding protein
MAINLNRVTITGYLIRDPVLHGPSPEKNVCDMSIACHRRWQDKLTGSWEEWIDYIKVRAVDSLAPLANEHLRQGSSVAIDGRIASQRADCNDPEHAWEMIVLAEEMQLIPKTPSNHQASPDPRAELGAENGAPRVLDALPGIDTPMAIEVPQSSTGFTSPLEH